MTDVLLIRHGVTSWNQARRIQGRSDLPLTEEARTWLHGRRLPPGFEGCRWQSSPLVRAVETARLLGAEALVPDPRLTESDWGEWEGLTLAEMRARDPQGFAENESRGLDFRPPGGESPREVAARLAGWFDEVATGEGCVVAVSHKGVIRAALSLATGWDMHDDFPHKLDWRAAHHFRAERAAGGTTAVTLVAVNLPLAGT